MTKDKTSLVRKAHDFAFKAHYGQKDDAGEWYFQAHVLPVYNIIKEVTHDPDILAAAFLHDTIENCNVSYNDIASEFNVRIADLVLELTHEGPEKGKKWFPNLHTRDAILIKFADRLQNLSRMGGWTPERQAAYLKKSKFWKSSKDDDWMLNMVGKL